jgi:hypothetical protein
LSLFKNITKDTFQWQISEKHFYFVIKCKQESIYLHKYPSSLKILTFLSTIYQGECRHRFCLVSLKLACRFILSTRHIILKILLINQYSLNLVVVLQYQALNQDLKIFYQFFNFNELTLFLVLIYLVKIFEFMGLNIQLIYHKILFQPCGIQDHHKLYLFYLPFANNLLCLPKLVQDSPSYFFDWN